MALVSRTKVNRMFRELMPTGVGELRAAYDEAEHVRDFAVLPANTHFMVGGKSPRLLQGHGRRLHAAVPGSTFELSPKGFHGSVPAAVKELVTDISEYFKG